jgi:hypothetical protein
LVVRYRHGFSLKKFVSSGLRWFLKNVGRLIFRKIDFLLKNMIKIIVLSNKYLNEDYDEPLAAKAGSGLERISLQSAL